MTPALASKALQSAGVFCILGIALGTCWHLGTPPTLGSSGYPTFSRRVASRSVLAQASPTIVGAGANRSIPVHPPSPLTLWLGMFGVVTGQVPCSALFRAAISLEIWLPSSFEPSVTPVAVDDLTLTFSLASSVLLSAFLAAAINWEYVVSGLLCRYLIESLMCLCTPWKCQSLRWHATLQSAVLLRYLSEI